MEGNIDDTTNLTSFYSNLATNADLQAALVKQFGTDADNVLMHLASGLVLDDDRAEEINDFILEFLDDNAVLIASYKGTGELTQEEHEVRQNEFQRFLPEAAKMINDQMQKLQDLAFSQNCNMASGQLEPFDISILKFVDLFIVETTDFETHYFANKDLAISFAQENYAPLTANYAKTKISQPDLQFSF